MEIFDDDQSNKIYVGNLPPTTREDDLLGCFGEMGRIVAVELKYGRFISTARAWILTSHVVTVELDTVLW